MSVETTTIWSRRGLAKFLECANMMDQERFKRTDAGSYDVVAEDFDDFSRRTTGPLAKQMVHLAGIRPSASVLDIGTGTGIVALEAAKLLRSTGVLTGVDLSQGMLSVASAKASEAGLDRRVRFLRMDAEALAFEDGSFDNVLTLFALFHFPNPISPLREMYRVLRPGGSVVVGVGSGAPRFSLVGLSHATSRLADMVHTFRGKLLLACDFLERMVENALPAGRAPEMPEWNRESPVKLVPKLVRQSGFDVDRLDWVGGRLIVDSPEEFWQLQVTFSSIVRKRLAAAAPDKVEALRKAFLSKCRTVQSVGGRLVYPYGALLVFARRPNGIKG